MASDDGRSAGGRIDRYELRSVLGEGAFGIVYEAFDTELHRPVALKVLSGAGDPTIDREVRRERLLREAKAMARLSHPNVVKVHDAGVHGDDVYIVMAHVDGETLGAWARRTRPDWRAAIDVMLGAGEGLAAAHDQGFVHRDFKPDNVLVDRSGVARVFDFGLVRAVEGEGGPIDREHWRTLTRAGVALGTPEYMPSEQLGGGTVDARSDQYAFCATLYELLYGRRPFEGDSLQALIDAVLVGKVTFPPAPAVPAQVRAVVETGLARLPAERHASMRDLLAALRAARAAPRGVPWLVVAGVGFLLAALTAVVVIIALRDPEASDRDIPDPAGAPLPDAQIAPPWIVPVAVGDKPADGGKRVDANAARDSATGAVDVGRPQTRPRHRPDPPAEPVETRHFDSLREYSAYLEGVYARIARQCLSEASTPEPSGNVSLRFRIDEDTGRVSGMRRSSGTDDDGWENCVVRRIEGYRFARYDYPIESDPTIRVPSR